MTPDPTEQTTDRPTGAPAGVAGDAAADTATEPRVDASAKAPADTRAGAAADAATGATADAAGDTATERSAEAASDVADTGTDVVAAQAARSAGEAGASAEQTGGSSAATATEDAAGASAGAAPEQTGDSPAGPPGSASTDPPAGAVNDAAGGASADGAGAEAVSGQAARAAAKTGAPAEQLGGPPVATVTEVAGGPSVAPVTEVVGGSAVATATEEAGSEEVEPRRRITSLEVLCVVLLLALIGQGWLASVLDLPAMRTGATVFVAICVQALPFLVLGVLVSGAIAAFVSADALRRVLPRRTALAVPAAGLAGVALPNCECAAVPVARRLIQQDVPAAVAVTFLLAAPAVNPVVMVATAVAFPGQPAMVLARFVGSMATAIVMGLLWSRFGRMEWFAERAMRRIPAQDGRSRWAVFAESARQDLVDAGGFLVLGGLTAAVMNVVVPRTWFDTLADQVLLGILVMAVLAVVLALCSEADAFVVASLSALPLLPRLVFLVVGPAIDIKLFALQAGTLGRRFAWRFAPLTFVVAIGCAVGAGVVFL